MSVITEQWTETLHKNRPYRADIDGLYRLAGAAEAARARAARLTAL